jgi:release factor glutamine methyltransferase
MKKELIIQTHKEVYEPAEDSYLLSENLETRKNDLVLDIGTGTGIQALTAARNAKKVLAVDINPHALETAKKNAELNKINNIEFRISNLFEKIKPKEKFDLIIFNPPYIPSHEKDLLGRAWAGGEKGREVIDKFIEQAPQHLKDGGRIMLLVSSINEPEDVARKLEKKKLSVTTTSKKKLFFEELQILKAVKKQ